VTADGRRLITASLDGTVKMWEAATPAQITFWAKQEQERAQRLTVWQRPVAGARGFIQDWLVLAPIPLEADQRGAKGLEQEQLTGEAKLRPRAGDHVPVDGREIAWKAHHGEHPILDFNGVVEKVCDHSVAYAVCYVISERERPDLFLQVGGDDEARVYLNGQEVYKHMLPRSLETLDTVGPVTLRKETNIRMLKVVNETGEWEGCARFVDHEGNLVQGLQLRLTPE
jgi:hypothetical protein